MPRRAAPAIIHYIGGPLDGQRQDRAGTGRWPQYRDETGQSITAERGDTLHRNGSGGYYLQEPYGGPHARRLGLKPSVGRVYVHASRIAAIGPVANRGVTPKRGRR